MLGSDEQESEDEGPRIYAVDGACRSCQFPLLNAKLDASADTLTCGLCGTSWSLDKGECIDFLPGSNPVQASFLFQYPILTCCSLFLLKLRTMVDVVPIFVVGCKKG